MPRTALPTLLLALAACDAGAPTYDDGFTDGEAAARAALQPELDALSAALDDALARLDAVEVDVGDLSEDVDAVEDAIPDVSTYVTTDILDARGFATQAWVEARGYAGQSTVDALDTRLTAAEAELTTLAAADTVDPADLVALDARLSAVESDYAVSADVDGLDARVSVLESDRVVSADLAPLATTADLDGVQASVDTVADDLSALDTRVDDLEGSALTPSDLDGLATEDFVTGQGYASQAAVDAVNATAASLSAALDDRVAIASDDVLITVPTDMSLPEALDALGRTWLAPGVIFEIDLEPGTYVIDGGLTLDHPQGDRVLIAGLGTQDDVILTATDAPAVVFLADGRRLGWLDHVTLDASIGVPHGVRARSGAIVNLGNDVRITGQTGDGVWAEHGAVVTTGSGGLTVDACGGAGVRATDGAIVFAPGVVSTDHGGPGLASARGGMVIAEAAVVADNGGPGIRAEDGALAHVPLALSERNATGFRADRASYIEASGATAQDNAVHGYSAISASMVYARGSAALGHPFDGLYAEALSHIDGISTLVEDNARYGAQSTSMSFVDRGGWSAVGNATPTVPGLGQVDGTHAYLE